MRQRQNTGDGIAVPERHANRQAVGHTSGQGHEPAIRLRRYPVPAPRQNQELVKSSQQGLRPTGLTGDAFALGAMNLALNRALVKTPEEMIERRLEVQLVQTEGVGDVREWSRSKVRTCAVSVPRTASRARSRHETPTEAPLGREWRLPAARSGPRTEPTPFCSPSTNLRTRHTRMPLVNGVSGGEVV